MKQKLKTLLLIPATLIFVNQPVQADPVDGYSSKCTMYTVRSKASNTPRPVQSDHTVSITNNSDIAQDYHVEWDNYINYTGFYTPNASKKFYVNVAPGETKNLTERISHDSYFYNQGTYPLKCTTNIYRNGMWVSTGEGKNNAYIE